MEKENGGTLLHETQSLCPVCLGRVPARRVRRGGDIYLEKTCPDHGDFSAITWREGPFGYEDWVARYPGEGCCGAPAGEAASSEPDCPYDCGICGGHRQATCCVLLEVTSRCDAACPFCFASGGDSVKASFHTWNRAFSGNARNVGFANTGTIPPDADPSIEELLKQLSVFQGPSKPFVYLSGGEPALRDDLPELIGRILEMGFPHVQINTNGLRLGRDPAYVAALARAGLSFVFLQFDGTSDDIHRAIRGGDYLADKLRAIENCDAQNLGVTLVPTVVPGVNEGNLGEIVRFAVGHAPAVRGVHFQPVTYLGRYPAPPEDDARITLPEVLSAIVAQSGGLVQPDSLLPSACDHPLCGFHGDYMVLADGSLRALSSRSASRPEQEACCCAPAGAVPVSPRQVEKNRSFVARRWKREAAPCCGEEADPNTLDGFLARVKSHGFTLTGMAFQDAHTLDLERLRRCSLHVVNEAGGVSPFCAHYMTAADGSRLLEKRNAHR